MFSVASLVLPETGDDRLLVSKADGTLTVAVADGAGGTTGAAKAAELALTSLASFCLPFTPTRVMENIDAILADDPDAGETTLVFALLFENSISGAAVGDSAAWLVRPSSVVDLSEMQKRKPLLGSGRAAPTEFGPLPATGRVLLATDGLLDFLPHSRIADVVLNAPLPDVPVQLASLASPKDTQPPDDIAIVVAEVCSR